MSKKPVYVAIDSDILRHLSYLDLLKKTYGRVEVDLVKDKLLKEDFNYYIRLLYHMKNDDIRMLIVDAVFQESKHSNSLLNFMREYCYFPNVNAVNYQEKATKARTLAKAFCSPYEFEGQQFDAPMKFVFVADINKQVPTNDAYIMAQATVENCCLLTGNKKDFIFNERQSFGNKDRVAGICRVNILNGYVEKTETGFYVSKPITIGSLVGSLKRNNQLGMIEQDEKVEGKTIL